MITSLDTYLYEEISKRLQIMLSECYIMNETLKDIDNEARTNFMKAYVGENPKKSIDVFYGVPQNKENYEASYAVTIGTSTELTKSIGGIQGNYSNREGSVISETVAIQKYEQDDSYLTFNTTYDVATIEGIPDIDFSSYDELSIINNRIVFKNTVYNRELLLNKEYKVLYTKLDDTVDVAGVSKGFTAVEELSITSLSTNYDTARCLDLILKLILITMRDSVDEHFSYNLQTLSFDALAPVISDGETIVYGRSVTISFTNSISVDSDFYKKITEIIVRRSNG